MYAIITGTLSATQHNLGPFQAEYSIDQGKTLMLRLITEDRPGGEPPVVMGGNPTA